MDEKKRNSFLETRSLRLPAANLGVLKVLVLIGITIYTTTNHEKTNYKTVVGSKTGDIIITQKKPQRRAWNIVQSLGLGKMPLENRTHLEEVIAAS